MGAPVSGRHLPSPPVLEPQAFGEVAAEIVLPEMAYRSVYFGCGLSAGLLSDGVSLIAGADFAAAGCLAAFAAGSFCATGGEGG